MDGSFFAFFCLGLLGYIVGDFQRERRYRREARANLTRANQRANDRANQRAAAARHLGTLTGSDSDSHNDGGTLDFGHSEARRRAVRGNNGWTRSSGAPAGRYLRSADAPPVMAGGAEFDGD